MNKHAYVCIKINIMRRHSSRVQGSRVTSTLDTATDIMQRKRIRKDTNKEINLIEDEECKIRNSKLFVASTKKNLKSVESLVRDGADVNYAGAGGNTPLHCATKDSSEGIVKYLLINGADVYIENDDGKTPFDFNYSSKSRIGKKIKAEFQKTIVNNAFTVLENHVKLIEFSEQDVEEDPEVSNDLICTKGFKWKGYSYDEEASYLDQDFFREVNKKVDKIKSCLRYLKTLKVGAKFLYVNTKFSYEQANIFIFFLEAVAFQDVELSGESKRHIRKEIEINVGSEKEIEINVGREKEIEINMEREKEIRKEIDKRRAQIVKDVKDYFTGNFYPSNFEEDIKLVDAARTLFCHKKIPLKDVGKLVCPGTSLASLFSKLADYASYICKRIDNLDRLNSNELTETIPLTSVLIDKRKIENLDIGSQGEGVLEEELANLIRATYNQEEWTRERTQEILFSFLVNISPTFGKEVSGLSKLRNKIIHEFHKYKDVDTIIKMEFKIAVFDLRSKLFKYYYAKTVNKILYNIKPSEDPKYIKANLSSALIEFEKKFGEQFKIASDEDTGGSFEYCSLTSETTGSFSKEEMSRKIKQYLKFMAIVDDDKIEQDRENRQLFIDITDTILENQCNDSLQYSDKEEDESEKNCLKISSIIELNIFRRREIFDKFLKLKQVYISLPRSQYLREKMVIKSNLYKCYGVNEHYFDAVCKMYVEKDDDLQKENQTHAKKIHDTINIIISFQSENTLSIRDIIILYTKVVEGKGTADLEKNFDNKEVPLSQMVKFQKDLSAVGLQNVLDIYVSGKQKVKLSAVKIVSNILNLFYNRYNSYQIKFNNIKEAFKDEKFLYNLIEEEKVLQNACDAKNKNFGFQYYKFMIFKKLLKIEYTAPYIARSIIEEGHINTMEKEDMLLLMQMLLDNNDYMDHVSELLKLSIEGVDMYQPVYDKVLKGNVDKMRQIFKEPIHVKKILQYLKGLDCDEETKIQLENQVLKLLNDIVYNLCCEGSNYDTALEILALYSSETDTESFNLELIEAKRLEAKIRIRKGHLLNQNFRHKDNSDALQQHKIALNFLCEIRTTMERKKMMFIDIKHASLYLLTLNHIAYTFHLLKDTVNSVKVSGKLFSEIKRFSLDMPTLTDSSRDRLEEYDKLINIVRQKPYTDLLAYSDETKEFLDLFKILKHIGNQMNIQSRTESSVKRALKSLEKSLHNFKEVYKAQKATNSQDLSQISNTARRIGTACICLAQFYLKFFSERKNVIKNYYIEALLNFTIMYKLEREKQQGHYDPTSNFVVSYVYKTLQALINSKTMKIDSVHEDWVVLKQTILKKIFRSKQLLKVNYCCKPRNKSCKILTSRKRHVQLPSTKALSEIWKQTDTVN